MATITTRTTQLEAVNTMLSTIGEAPVNSLTGSLPVDASMAVNILNEVNREVQSAGWKFNTPVEFAGGGRFLLQARSPTR